MTHLRLAATMLRYRVASLLLPFFLLAPALHDQLQSFRWTYVAGQLIAIAFVAAVIALIAGFVIGPVGFVLVAVSLLLNVAYSAPPLRLCARALAAPPVLGFAYVILPYGIGLAAAGLSPTWFDARVATCFVILFTGRMLLKDFRDRRGDAAFDKRTLLLTYGKRATLVAVLACVVAGDGLLLTVLPMSLPLIAVIESYFVAIAFQLYRLWLATGFDDERVAIAMGARMGNAVVLTLLGFVVLRASGAAAAEQGFFVLALALMFWFAFIYLSTRPREAVAAYRG
jgi:4-hydroxybenzoate polyprenyltransferase